MYVVPPAYKIMLSRSGAHTKRAGEQTNSVITYYCAVSVLSRSKENKQNCIDVSVWLHKWGGLNILLCARILKNQNLYILGIWASWCIITDYY